MSIKLMLGGQVGTAEWFQGARSYRHTVPFERKEPALLSGRPQDMTASARLNPLVDDPGDRLCPAQPQLRNGLRHAVAERDSCLAKRPAPRMSETSATGLLGPASIETAIRHIGTAGLVRHAGFRSLPATVVQSRKGPEARCAGLPVEAAQSRSGTQGYPPRTLVCSGEAMVFGSRNSRVDAPGHVVRRSLLAARSDFNCCVASRLTS